MEITTHPEPTWGQPPASAAMADRTSDSSTSSSNKPGVGYREPEGEWEDGLFACANQVAPSCTYVERCLAQTIDRLDPTRLDSIQLHSVHPPTSTQPHPPSTPTKAPSPPASPASASSPNAWAGRGIAAPAPASAPSSRPTRQTRPSGTTSGRCSASCPRPSWWPSGCWPCKHTDTPPTTEARSIDCGSGSWALLFVG